MREIDRVRFGRTHEPESRGGLRLGRSHRSQITLAAGLCSACALVAVSAPAHAQDRAGAVECRKTETQAECHARLKCRADEELEDCQKRLLKCGANEALEDCKKRGGAKEGDSGKRGEDDRKGRDGDADETGHDRDEDSGREGGEGRDRDEGAGSRRERGEGGEGGEGQASDKTFGLGVEIGEPTGLNGKYFFSEKGALDFGIGWIYRHYYYGDGVNLYVDLLYHPVSLVSASAFELPFYIGGGLRYWNFDYCHMGVCDYDGSAFGIRIPFGISFVFNDVPLDIFLQIVPVIDFVSGDYYDRFHDRTHVGIDGSVGLRFWF